MEAAPDSRTAERLAGQGAFDILIVADALRLRRTETDLRELLSTMTGLYEPSTSEKGFRLRPRGDGEVRVFADTALLHRMIANLLHNELKHLPMACTLTIEVRREEDGAQLILEDDGVGFEPEMLQHSFERRVKGRKSNGHGLAFVDAVARDYGGMVRATNKEGGGVRIIVTFPPATTQQLDMAACTHASN